MEAMLVRRYMNWCFDCTRIIARVRYAHVDILADMLLMRKPHAVRTEFPLGLCDRSGLSVKWNQEYVANFLHAQRIEQQRQELQQQQLWWDKRLTGIATPSPSSNALVAGSPPLHRPWADAPFPQQHVRG